MKAWVLAALPSAFALMPAMAQEAPLFPAIPTGSDFCFSRTYDDAHLASHPDQVVRRIAVMGRNARGDAGWSFGGIFASLAVEFRDEKFPMAWNGLCFEVDMTPSEGAQPEAALKCSFFPEENQDILVSELIMTDRGDDRFHAEANGDWLTIRTGEEPDGSYGSITTDDKEFILSRAPLEECAFDPLYWGEAGATDHFRGSIP